MTDDISKQIEEYEARGGKINFIPSGVSSDPIPFTTRNESGKPRALTKAERETARRASLSSYGKFNIRHAKMKTLTDGGLAYGLYIAKKRYGTYYSEEDFFEARQKVYNDLGLTFNDGKR